MPTPIELLLDPISVAVFALYGGLMLWEALVPGRPLPEVPGWEWRGLAAFGAYFFLSTYLPMLRSEQLARYAAAFRPDCAWHLGRCAGRAAGHRGWHLCLASHDACRHRRALRAARH